MKTYAQLEQRLFDWLNRPYGEYDKRLTTDRVAEFIDEARRFVARRCKLIPISFASYDISKGQTDFSLDYADPPMRDVKWVGFSPDAGLTPIKQLKDIERAGYNSYMSSRPGVPRMYLLSGNGVQIYPSPDRDYPSGLFVFGRTDPRSLSYDNDVSDLPEDADEMAIIKAAMDILSGLLADESNSESRYARVERKWDRDWRSFHRTATDNSILNFDQVSRMVHLETGQYYDTKYYNSQFYA